ncbi:DUF6343 family protein [Kitasatospora sp. KL5]|uniref:DUF6343 family protein n=1 Tax=Kitasatospora sp. KL5 TaxID=3425125 RepID=UPI003D701107
MAAPLLGVLTALFAFWAVAAGDDGSAGLLLPASLALACGALTVLTAADLLVLARCRQRRHNGGRPGSA